MYVFSQIIWLWNHVFGFPSFHKIFFLKSPISWKTLAFPMCFLIHLKGEVPSLNSVVEEQGKICTIWTTHKIEKTCQLFNKTSVLWMLHCVLQYLILTRMRGGGEKKTPSFYINCFCYSFSTLCWNYWLLIWLNHSLLFLLVLDCASQNLWPIFLLFNCCYKSAVKNLAVNLSQIGLDWYTASL